MSFPIIDFRSPAQPPAFPITRTIQVRDLLQQGLVQVFPKTLRWTLSEVAEATRLLYSALSDQSVKVLPFVRTKDALRQYLTSYIGSTVDRDGLKEIATVVAGNIGNFMQGVPFKRWDGLEPVWASVYILDAERSRGCRRYQLHMRVCHGPASYIQILKKVSRAYARHLIRDMGGVYKEEYTGSDLGGLWFTCMLSGNDEQEVTFKDVCVSSSQHTYNRRILKARQGSCIQEAYRGYPCHNCNLGRHQCALARHSKPYAWGPCCNTSIPHRGWLVVDNICLYCLEKGYEPFKQEDTENDDAERFSRA